MTDLIAHRVDPADERRHAPGPEMLWNESYYLDFVSGDSSIGGYVRIGFYPNLGVTWWTTMIVGAGRPVVASVAYDLPAGSREALGVSAGGVDARLEPEVALGVMALRATAPATAYGQPAAVYRGEPGRDVGLGLDLVWTTDGVPYHYELTTRYEVPCLVSGELRIGDERVPVEGHGQRDHSWGVRDWWAFGWCWSAARLTDGTRVHAADIRVPGRPVAFGYLQTPGRDLQPVSDLEVTEVRGTEGMPVSARARLQPGGLDLEIRPIAYGPLLLVAPDGRTSRFPRAMAHFAATDGRTGTGWIEWNQPDPSGAGR